MSMSKMIPVLTGVGAAVAEALGPQAEEEVQDEASQPTGPKKNRILTPAQQKRKNKQQQQKFSRKQNRKKK